MPWKLWEKSKKLFWDPADIDFSQDAVDWQEMTDEERTQVAMSARGFMVGEEAVTLDIVPLLRCMSDLGRLEDTMYLAMFAMEEAKHTEMFRRWFDAVGMDPASLDDLVRAQKAARAKRRQPPDRRLRRRAHPGDAPARHRPVAGGHPRRVHHLQPARRGRARDQRLPRWDEVFRKLGKLPGLQAGLKLTQRDERRHIAYGTYLARRVLAENPELWEFTERRWARLTSGFVGGYGSAAPVQDAAVPDFDAAELKALADRRLEALRVAATMRPADVERADVESFVPAELASII